jgi:hypothetical protein
MRQKTGEIKSYQVYEKGEEKCRKEQISRKGKGDISEEVSDRRYWKTETYGGTKQSY